MRVIVLMLISSFCFAQKQVVDATDNLNTGRGKINSNFTEVYDGLSNLSTAWIPTSSPSNGLYQGQSLYTMSPIVSGTTGFEFLHLGLRGSSFGPNTDFLQVPKGLVVVNWSTNIVNNWKWNNSLERAEYYNATYPMIDLEIGREGVLCHYTKPGSIPATSFHEITRFGGAVDGVTGLTSELIPFNQFKAGMFACYKSSTTPTGDADPWWGGSDNNNPFLWMMTPETKGTDNEFVRFDGFTTYGSMVFQRAQGTYGSKTACSVNAQTGGIFNKVYDGSAYQTTAQINFVSQAGTISSGVAGSRIQLRTSPTNTAGLVNRMEITESGSLLLDRTITTAGTTGNQTINKMSGTVNFAAAATSLTVTNSLCTTSSIVFAVIRTNDTTAIIKNVVPGSGSFVINLDAAATAETSVGFFITN